MPNTQKPDSSTSSSSILPLIVAIVTIAVALTTLALNWKALTRAEKKPILTVENKLALPVIVTINDRPSYTKRVEPGGNLLITLLSDSDFPARVHWEVVRQKNVQGQPLGEALNDDQIVDKEKTLTITNVIGLNIYFYPIIHNNTNYTCHIVLNDGLSIEYKPGLSTARRKTNIIGYYKLAKNSNIALYCPDKTYWEGQRNGKQSRHGLQLTPESGIVDFYAP